MKKKLLTLCLVFAMLFSMALVANAANTISGGDALKANGETAIILDVRSADKAHLAGSLSIPLFDSDNNLTEELAAAFSVAVKDNADLQGKDIYILCNSGARGAENATKLLVEAGYDESKLYTITNGAKSLQIRYEFLNAADKHTVENAEAVAAIENDNVVILDVRTTENYNKGHLALSVHIPVFTANGPVDRADKDQLAIDFVNAAKDNAALQGKDIYILCNSGSRGAKAATVLLQDAGYSLDNIYTIKGGAGGDAVKAKLKATVTDYKFVSGGDAVKADENKFVIDVRTKANYDAGTIKGAVNWPLFNASGVTNGSDELAREFLATVEANASLLEGKKIYVLCNSGARGAQNATQLLAFAGYDVSTGDSGVVYTIKNGAKSLQVRYEFLNHNNTVTGKEAVAAAENNAVVIDVRNNTKYNEGHLEGSIHLPVFGEDSSLADRFDGLDKATTDALSKAFVEGVKANASALEGKKIYILCNSGSRGAKAATVLLKDAGYSLENIYTITGGATDEDVKAAFVTTPAQEQPEQSTNTEKAPATGDATPIMIYAIAMLAAAFVIVRKRAFR